MGTLLFYQHPQASLHSNVHKFKPATGRMLEVYRSRNQVCTPALHHECEPISILKVVLGLPENFYLSSKPLSKQPCGNFAIPQGEAPRLNFKEL